MAQPKVAKNTFCEILKISIKIETKERKREREC
jgi:hypothetical protein